MIDRKTIMTREETNLLCTGVQRDLQGHGLFAKEGALAVMLMLTSGARSGEILCLKCGDIDSNAGTLTIREVKTHTRRVVRISDEEKKAVAELVDGKNENEPMFSITKGSLEKYVKTVTHNPSMPLYAIRNTYMVAARGLDQGNCERHEYSRKQYNYLKSMF